MVSEESSSVPDSGGSVRVVKIKPPDSGTASHPAKRRQQFKRSRRKSSAGPKHGDEQHDFRFPVLLTDSQQRKLRETTKELMRPGLGILAADDSKRQVDARLEELDLAVSDETRRLYQEVLLGGSEELNTYLSGIIVRPEALNQVPYRGTRLLTMIKRHKLRLGVRLDGGVVPVAGTRREYTTTGLNTLENSCKVIKDKGAEFALWRCVYRLSEFTPSRMIIQENSHVLGRFGSVCQTLGLVPVLSCELVSEGTPTRGLGEGVLREILTGLVKSLSDHHVYLEGALVRVSAIPDPPPVKNSAIDDVSRVARGTAKTINECLPAAIGGVLLAREEDLSRSVAILNALQTCPIKKPFPVSFCFSRVIQADVTSLWSGQSRNLSKARAELMKKLKICSLASFGQCPNPYPSFFVETTCPY